MSAASFSWRPPDTTLRFSLTSPGHDLDCARNIATLYRLSRRPICLERVSLASSVPSFGLSARRRPQKPTPITGSLVIHASLAVRPSLCLLNDNTQQLA